MVKSLFYLFLFLLIKLGDVTFSFVSTIKRIATSAVAHIRSLFSERPQKHPQPAPVNMHNDQEPVRLPSRLHVHRKKLPQKKWNIHFPTFHFVHKRHTMYRKKPQVQKPAPYKASFFYKIKFLLLGFVIAFFFIFVPLLFFVFISDLPNPNNLSIEFIPKTTKIFDRHGTLLYEIYADQNRTTVNLSDIPLSLQQATIAIEDRDFYNHPGFDIRGILRAFFSDVQNNGFQGGSTITQQLIKSAFFSPEPSLIRKVREIVLAFWAERIYTKNQILAMYFNYVPYGGTAWGAESASEIYFGQSVKDLDLAQSAFLAGLPQSPSVYSPYASNSSQQLWKKRQKQVLDAMVKSGDITSSQETQAYDEQLIFQPPQVPLLAPHFVMYVRDLLEQKYGLYEVERGGLHVITSLDLPLQNTTQQIVSTEVAQDGPLNISNGAALITNPTNGDILAMVGSRDYFDTANDGNVNLTTALRQPGSTIKLITYSLALSNGYTEETPIQDEPLTINLAGETYTPVNYDGKFHGTLPLRLVLGNSLNIPAVRVAAHFGVPAIVTQGQKMGISSWKTPNNYGISITLGGADTTMTDLATAFGTIADNGQRVDLDPLLSVRNSDGTVLYQKNPIPKPVLDPGVAYIMSDILADNNNRLIEFGTNTPLIIPGHRVQVKTGTTDQKRDNWTIGFTPNILVATWVGNNDNSPMSQALASGITGAAPMWNKIMTGLLNGTTDTPLTVPADIVSKQCNGRIDYFIKGTENSVSCGGIPLSPSPSLHP